MAFVPHTYNPPSPSESDYPVPSYTASDASPHYYTIYSPVDNPPHWQATAGPTYDVSYNSDPPVGHLSARMPFQSSELPLHAPAPLSGQASALLTSCTGAYYAEPMKTNDQSLDQSQILPPSLPHLVCESYKSLSGEEPSATRRPPTTFPTPSAMLTELAVNVRPPSLMPVQTSEPKNETARKARRRAMAQTIGFEPTDPDVISSHEKKRHYLECLEYYVTYLHQQLSLVGCEPARLERPPTSTRGMSSQSIRTLLVHMEHLTRRLNQEMLAEEQRFIHLRGIAEQLQDSRNTEA